MLFLSLLLCIGCLAEGILEGNVCRKRGQLTCCSESLRRDDICLACPRGTFGINCTLCPDGRYGNNCSLKCACRENELCHPRDGCQVFKESTTKVFPIKVSTGEIVMIGLLLLITILCSGRLIEALCAYQQKKGQQTSFFVGDYDDNPQSYQVERTTVYSEDPLTNDEYDIYGLNTTRPPIQQDTGTHYGNCGIEHFTYRQDVNSTALPANTRSHYGDSGVDHFSCTRL